MSDTPRTRLTGFLVLGTIIVVALILLVQPSASTRAADRSIVGSSQSLRSEAIGCTSEDSLDRLSKIAGDRLAAMRYLMNRANGCAQFSPGKVTVEDADRDLVKVRPAGDPTSYWILRSALSGARQ